jgi:hypothetical protein
LSQEDQISQTLRKQKPLAESPEAQFQPPDDLLDLAVTEMVNEVMLAYEYAPTSEINQSFGDPTEHQGTQNWQGYGPV